MWILVLALVMAADYVLSPGHAPGWVVVHLRTIDRFWLAILLTGIGSYWIGRNER